MYSAGHVPMQSIYKDFTIIMSDRLTMSKNEVKTQFDKNMYYNHLLSSSCNMTYFRATKICMDIL